MKIGSDQSKYSISDNKSIKIYRHSTIFIDNNPSLKISRKGRTIEKGNFGIFYRFEKIKMSQY